MGIGISAVIFPLKQPRKKVLHTGATSFIQKRADKVSDAHDSEQQKRAPKPDCKNQDRKQNANAHADDAPLIQPTKGKEIIHIMHLTLRAAALQVPVHLRSKRPHPER